jgi:polyhydroxybutyrate depolymerase
MQKIKYLLILAILLLLNVSCGTANGTDYASSGNPGKSVLQSIQCDGFKREFIVHLPDGYNDNEEYPLVLCFHGRGGSARHTEKKTSFSDIADREEFIVVYPDGINKAWYLSDATINQPNDINFSVKLIEHLCDEFPIDKTRIFAAGHSNGGFLSIYLAVRHSNTFAAIASVSGGLALIHTRDFNPDYPVSILLIHGTKDTTVPYNGGSLFLKRKGFSGTKFKIIPALELADLWINHNKCETEPVIEELPNEVRLDGTTVTITTWSNSQDDSEVMLYTIDGGKHGWPTKNIDSSSLIPGTCREIEAAEEIWEFFSRHAKSTDTKSS